ncbi:MAG: gamma-glutamyl-gamma-aminobutyrate hydrolase family protein [Chloroflexota bacterium]
MVKPIIGLTSFALELPCPRSVVNQAYVDAIVAAGGAPIVIPLSLDAQSIERVYELLDGLLLPGGDDVAPAHYGEQPHHGLGQVDRARDELELALTRRALQDDMPILGICRGIQLLAVAAGGTLYQDLPSQHRSTVRHEVREFGRDHVAHAIHVDPLSHLAAALQCDTLGVNSFHHQAIRDVPAGFVVTATSSDGIIEAIEAPAHRFTVGVQCHPEEIWKTAAPEFAGLFQSFVNSVREHCARSASLAS